MCLLRRHHVIAIAQRSCARAWSRQGEDARRLQHNRGEAVERARLGYACRPGAWARWPQAGAAEVAGRRQRAATAAARMGPSRAPPRVARDAISVQSSRPAKDPNAVRTGFACMQPAEVWFTIGPYTSSRRKSAPVRPLAQTSLPSLRRVARWLRGIASSQTKPVRGVAASSVASHACTDGDCERGREGGREPEGYPRVNFKSLCGAPRGGIA